MKEETKKVIRGLLNDLGALDYITPAEIPDIPLYMDQITTFMDAKLASGKRHPEDKILTKTMINNYTKNNLIPPPVKKKYSKDHLLLLIFVYYLKDFLSISDIETLLKPLIADHFGEGKEISVSDIYDGIYGMETHEMTRVVKDLIHNYETAIATFPEAEGSDADYLHTYAFICLLSFDVYIKKQLIVRILDEMGERQSEEEAGTKAVKKEAAARKAPQEKKAKK